MCKEHREYIKEDEAKKKSIWHQSKLILQLTKESLLLCPPLRCLPSASLFYHLTHMPILLASISVAFGKHLLDSGIINWFKLSDSLLIALCFLQFREDGEVLP